MVDNLSRMYKPSVYLVTLKYTKVKGRIQKLFIKIISRDKGNIQCKESFREIDNNNCCQLCMALINWES